MTLVSSGTLNLKGSASIPTRSIEFECEGAVSGTFALTTAQGIASAYVGSLPTGMTDFYGFNNCTESIPNVPSGVSASWIINGVIQVAFTKPGDADGIDLEMSTNNSTWLPFTSGYTGNSPYASSNSCTYTWYRVRAYNCAGSSPYSNGSNAGSCPP
jgi:hypothetical protein